MREFIQLGCVATETVCPHFAFAFSQGNANGTDDSVALGASTNVALLEKIVSDQRGIFQNVFGNGTDVTTIPQAWCLCEFHLLY